MKLLFLASTLLAPVACAFAPPSSNHHVQRLTSTGTVLGRFTRFATDLPNDDEQSSEQESSIPPPPTPPPPTPKKEMSKALPFMPRPMMLDGSLPGDVGFDPFGFSGTDKANLIYMREAEIKHCRLAMLAAIGWPLAELWDKSIADVVGLPTALTKSGESPSILNGGLDRISAAYWVAVVALAGIVELESSKMQEQKKNEYVLGDCGLSGLLPMDKKAAFDLQTKEIKNGRLAMMAILGFVVQEALHGKAVIEQTPFFFHPLEGVF